mmetsp:Transcript_31028/g.74978  ORF Transcript_31028/g.74978 Transcript_31028/m.74978 type:complete len:274 (-) Transcript_31028:85-906(-)
MDCLVQILEGVGGDVVLDVLREMFLVLLVIFLLEVFHVFTDVSTHDAFTVHVGIVLLGVTVVARETLFGVGDIKTAIGCTLQGTEDSVSGGRWLTSNIQQTAEGTLVVIDFLYVVCLVVIFSRDDVSVDFGVTLIDIVESDLLKQTACDEEASAVSGGVVLQPDVQPVPSQFGRLGLAEDAVTIDQGVRDLADHLRVGEPDDETVLGRLVLVLVLGAQTLTLTVVGLTFTATTELDLVPRKVRLGLLDLDESFSFWLSSTHLGRFGFICCWLC